MYYLRLATSHSPHAATQHGIRGIIRRTLETNSVTLGFALANAVLFPYGNGSWYIIPQLALVKLYCNSFLVSRTSPVPAPLN